MARLLGITTVFKIFFKYPIRYIPVISKGEIFSFVSKDLVLKQSNLLENFSKAGEKFLDLVLEDPDLQTFFSHIQNSNLEKIPIIDKDRLQISITKYMDFISRFFPISRLEASNFFPLVEQLDTVILVCNTKRDLIYSNVRAKLFCSDFCKKQKISQENFIQEIFANFPTENLKKPSSITATSHAGKFLWKKQLIFYPEGIITLFQLQNLRPEKLL